MRVVDVTQWYSPVSGGIRTYLRAKAAWAGANGRAHGVVATGAEEGRDAVSGTPFVLVRGRTPTDRWGYRPAVRPGAMLAALAELRPSVVVVHDAFAFPRAIARWAARRGVAMAMVCHSDLALAVAGLPRPVRAGAGRALRARQRSGMSAAGLVIVASEATRARLAPDAAAPLRVSPLGVDASAFRGARPDARLRARLAPGPRRLLLYAGRLSSEKRVDLLPRALAALDDRHVMAIAGTGAAGRRMMRSARRLGVDHRMTLLGHVADRGDLARLMATADCFVHPNPEEPFGLGPLEAIAAGCRVVAPRTGGPAELLGGRGAVLVAPGDAGALARGVLDALERPRPQADLADLSWDRTFAREWDMYSELEAAA